MTSLPTFTNEATGIAERHVTARSERRRHPDIHETNIWFKESPTDINLSENVESEVLKLSEQRDLEGTKLVAVEPVKDPNVLRDALRPLAIEKSKTEGDELTGYVKRIEDNRAYLSLTFKGQEFERVISLSRLKAAEADREGARVKIITHMKGAKLEALIVNLDEIPASSWRHTMRPELIQRIGDIGKFAIKTKPREF